MKFNILFNMAYKEKYSDTKGAITFLKYAKQLNNIITSFENSTDAKYKNFIDVNSINQSTYIDIIEVFKKRNNKDSTIQRKLNTLAGILTYGEGKGIIKNKPKLPQIDKAAPKSLYFNLLDEIELLNYFYHNNIKLYYLFFLSFNTGIRIGNLLSINDKNIIKDELVIFDTKNGDELRIPIIQEFRYILKKLKELNYFYDYDYNRAYYRFKKAIEILNFDPKLSPHKARHSFTTNLMALKTDKHIVKLLLAHRTSKEVTERYNHYDFKAEKIEALRVLIRKKKEAIKEFFKLKNNNEYMYTCRI